MTPEQMEDKIGRMDRTIEMMSQFITLQAAINLDHGGRIVALEEHEHMVMNQSRRTGPPEKRLQ